MSDIEVEGTPCPPEVAEVVDLLPLMISTEPNTPISAGTPFTVYCDVFNQGTKTSGPFQVHLLRRKELDGGQPLVWLNKLECAGLASGTNVTIQYRETAGLPKGNYQYTVLVDCSVYASGGMVTGFGPGVVSEINETNNEVYYGVVVV